MAFGRKKISRRKNGEKPVKNYFTNDTQKAIVKYQEEQDQEKKHALYTQEIMPAFSSLIDNLINVYGFNVAMESKEDLRNECMVFLYGVINKFNAAKGSKAFSYFNVVGKHWLTIFSKKNAKMITSHVSLNNIEALSTREYEIIENYNIIPSCDEVVKEEEIKANINNMLANLSNKIKTDNEAVCIEAIQLLFDNINDIDLISKRAVLCYLREITNFSPKQLSLTLSSIKKQYKEVKKEKLKAE